MPGTQEEQPDTPAAVAPVEDALLQQVRAVAAARASRDALKLQYDRSYESWLQKHSELAAAVEQSAVNARKLEDALRSMGEKVYEQTRNKQLLQGVSIREVVKLSYDPVAAFEWAQKTGLCLTLDVKAFDAVAKVNALAFVKRDAKPQVILAQDLTQYLREPTE